MDAPVSQTGTARTGIAAQPSRGIPSFVFFGLIIVAVTAAGIVGVTIWGPEKEIKNRSHLASDPPAATELPSLPADPSASAAPADSAAPAEATPAESAAAPAEGAPKPKRRGGKKPPKTNGGFLHQSSTSVQA